MLTVSADLGPVQYGNYLVSKIKLS